MPKKADIAAAAPDRARRLELFGDDGVWLIPTVMANSFPTGRGSCRVRRDRRSKSTATMTSARPRSCVERQRIDRAAVDQDAAVELERAHEAGDRHRGGDRRPQRSGGEHHLAALVEVGGDQHQRDLQVGEIVRHALRQERGAELVGIEQDRDCRSGRRQLAERAARAPISRRITSARLKASSRAWRRIALPVRPAA